MPMVSGTRVSAGAYTVTSDGALISSGLYPSLTSVFRVHPDPCINPMGWKLPGTYSFSKELVKNPSGYVRSYYYGTPTGESSRRRVDSSYDGTFSTAMWEQFYNGGDTGFGTPFRFAIESNNARNRAVNKLYDKIRDSEVNLSTTIGEGRESLVLIAAIARSVRHPVSALSSIVHKSRVRESAAASKLRRATVTVGGLALGYNLALKPLLSDVESLRKHLSAAEDVTLRYRANSRGAHSESWVTQSSDYEQWSVEESHRYQFGVTYRIGDMTSFENWRLGLTVRPTLAWELTTLSFVVDYFFKIGNFLAAYEAAYLNNGITLEHGYETRTTKKSAEYLFIRSDPEPFDRGTSTDQHLGDCRGQGYRKWLTKSRALQMSFPVQAYPTIKLPTAASQLINCAALLAMFLRR